MFIDVRDNESETDEKVIFDSSGDYMRASSSGYLEYYSIDYGHTITVSNLNDVDMFIKAVQKVKQLYKESK